MAYQISMGFLWTETLILNENCLKVLLSAMFVQDHTHCIANSLLESFFLNRKLNLMNTGITNFRFNKIYNRDESGSALLLLYISYKIVN